jgi:hypothetical protein
MEAVISRLEEKLQLLLKKMQLLQEENQRLQQQAAQWQQQYRTACARIEELENQTALVRIASATGDGQLSDRTRIELRSTINKYIREIDHCIAQLNE